MQTYFRIYDWMIRAGLNGNNLLVYAIVFQMATAGRGCYFGGYDNLAKRLNISRRNAIQATNYLTKIGAITKAIATNNQRGRTELHINPNWAENAQKSQNVMW